MRRTALYLYGEAATPDLWSEMLYTDVLHHKIVLANKVIRQVVKKELTLENMSRIKDCTEAIKFNQGLLDELKDT